MQDKYNNKFDTQYGPRPFPSLGPPVNFGQFSSFIPPPYPSGPPPSDNFGQFPPFFSPPHGFPHGYPSRPHQSCDYYGSHPYPIAGSFPYPEFNPHIAANYPRISSGSSNTININNMNSNDKRDPIGISSYPTSINTNRKSHSDVLNHQIVSKEHQHSTDVLSDLQEMFGGFESRINFGETQALGSSNANSTSNHNANASTAIGNSSNVQLTQNEFNTSVANNTNILTPLNGSTTDNNDNSTGISNQFTLEAEKFKQISDRASMIVKSMSSPATVKMPSISRKNDNDDTKLDIDIRFGRID